MITTDRDDDYLTRHRDELLAALVRAHPVAALRALAVALAQSERGEDIAQWIHELLRHAPGDGYEFHN